MDYYYHKPEFELEAKRIKNGPYAAKKLEHLCSKITDGTHYTPTYVEAGTPFISVKDVREFAISFADTKFVSDEEHKELTKRCNPEPGDILLTKVGTIGLAAIVTDDSPEFDLFVSVCLLKLRDRRQARFLCAVLNSPVARLQFARALKGIGVPDLHLENIRDVLIPLPPVDIQSTLVSQLEAARASRREKLAQADALLAGLDSYLLGELELESPENYERQFFAVRLGAAKARFDADFHSPRFQRLLKSIENGPHPVVSVGDVTLNLETGFASGRDDQADDEATDGVPHIRPMNITPRGEFSLDKCKWVPPTAISEKDWLQPGEVLFNNTNSTAWVGKTAVFEGTIGCVCSNHITRLKLVSEGINAWFVAALFNALRSTGLFGLLSTNFNNQAGINAPTLKSLHFPLPPLEVQERIATEVQSRRQQAQTLRAEAEAEWAAAKARFEQQLLGEVELEEVV